MKITIEVNPFRAAYEAFQKARVDRAEKARLNRRNALLARAKMSVFQWNTGVVRPTGPGFRIQVARSFDPNYNDCVGISVRFDSDAPGIWYYTSFSPARARILAEQLLLMAEHIEKNEPSSMNIDEEKAA